MRGFESQNGFRMISCGFVPDCVLFSTEKIDNTTQMAKKKVKQRRITAQQQQKDKAKSKQEDPQGNVRKCFRLTSSRTWK